MASHDLFPKQKCLESFKIIILWLSHHVKDKREEMKENQGRSLQGGTNRPAGAAETSCESPSFHSLPLSFESCGEKEMEVQFL